MLRRTLSLAAALLCAGPMAANAQFMGGGPAPQTTDCSNPANASSPQCNGTSANPYTPGQQYGTGQGAYVPGGQGQPPSAMGGNGIRQTIPTYVDQFPNGNQLGGAYPNGYSPYAGLQPKQPLTEFQRVVAGSVGTVLPIFGANLFSSNAGQFAPVDRAPVTSDYVVGPGDGLLVRVWGQVNFNVHATVDRAGDIYIPQVGNVEVAGLHFQQLNDYLKTQLGRVFRNFDLSVNMGQLRSVQIYVVGNARQPGSYTVSSLSTLVNALFSSGGPSEQGSMRRIELRREGKVVTTFDLYDLLIDGDKSRDAPLLPGDVVYIPPVGPEVAIAGSVHVPAIYELKGTETAAQAIALAGGLGTTASKQEAQLDRTGPNGTRRTVQIALDAAGMGTPLRDGDILRVPAMAQQFERTVILRGNVADPGRYRWTPGMRILDLIPDKDSLQTRGYWQRRIALGLPAPEYTPLFSAYRATLPNPSTEHFQGRASGQQQNGNAYTTGTSLAGTQREQSNEQAPLVEQAPAQQTTQNAPNAFQAAGTSGPNPEQPSSAFAGNSRNSLESDMRNQENSRKNSLPALRYFPPGDRFSQGQFPIENELLRAAPSIDWSYAVIERTDPHTLATSLIPFSLGKAVLDKDPSQNLELAPGDVVTVFSTADIQVPQAQRVKYVSLQGEVVHAGIYSVQPGETLRDVVARAGGLTPKAYLYGSEFLRESTQRLQQARLDEYVNSIERDIQLSAANAAGSLVNPTGAAALGTSIQSQRSLIVTLRKMRATGRIVLNLTPYSRGLDALPNLPLEDGDRFIVPVVPATVNVVGAVYDQNSFLYRHGKHVQDYLRVAGGTTRNADKRHEFVIRADGSVVSKQTAGGTLFAGEFSGKFAYPGDTVVVPDNINKTTVLRGLTDWSTVFSQFGLGVAALTLFGL
ncbi:MAG: polysaccharide biosynthesis/export family protein [Acidobacteriaceae bacterium]